MWYAGDGFGLKDGWLALSARDTRGLLTQYTFYRSRNSKIASGFFIAALLRSSPCFRHPTRFQPAAHACACMATHPACATWPQSGYA